MLLAEEVAEVHNREGQGDLVVYIQNVHIWLTYQETFVDEVEEEFKELSSWDHLHIHLGPMGSHKALVTLPNGLEVEFFVAAGFLVCENQDNDLCLR